MLCTASLNEYYHTLKKKVRQKSYKIETTARMTLINDLLRKKKTLHNRFCPIEPVIWFSLSILSVYTIGGRGHMARAVLWRCDLFTSWLFFHI